MNVLMIFMKQLLQFILKFQIFYIFIFFINSLKMGNDFSLPKPIQKLKVATLNFSANQLSPFQYFTDDNSIQQHKLNQIFYSKIKLIRNKEKLFEEGHLKKLSKIDKSIKLQRYSPLYNQFCGVKDGKFLNLESFQVLWKQRFKQNQAWRKLNHQQNQQSQKIVMEKHKTILDQLMWFDYLAYESILQYVYESNSIQSIIKDRPCTKYNSFMEQFFSKSYLNQNKKIIDVIGFLKQNDLDVLFIQEATFAFCRQLEKMDFRYRFIMSKQVQTDPGISVVVFKQESFKKADVGRKGNLKLFQILNDKKLDPKTKQHFLNWGKIAVISIDNFILISADIGGEAKRNHMMEDLKLIKEKLPTKYVIIGAKIKKLNEQLLPANMKHFPDNLLTCFKKRTYMQFQYEKINQSIKGCQNYIIYDQRLHINAENESKQEKGKIKNGVYTIQKQNISIRPQMGEKQIPIGYLPTNDHPFDQLIVSKILKIPHKRPKKTLSKEEQIKKKKDGERLGFPSSSSEEEEVQ